MKYPSKIRVGNDTFKRTWSTFFHHYFDPWKYSYYRHKNMKIQIKAERKSWTWSLNEIGYDRDLYQLCSGKTDTLNSLGEKIKQKMIEQL